MQKAKNEKLLCIIPFFNNFDPYHRLLYFASLPEDTLQATAFLQERCGIKTNYIDMRFEDKQFLELSMNASENGQNLKERLIHILNRHFVDSYNTILLSMTSNFQFLQTRLIAETIKEVAPQSRIIVAGYHSSSLPQDFIYAESPFDVILSGEITTTLYNLLNQKDLKKNMTENTTSYPIIYSSKDLIQLELLPFPDYDGYLQKYPMPDHFQFSISMSKGCPFQCKFCRIIQHSRIRNYSFSQFKKRFENLLNISRKYNKKLNKIGFLDQSFNSATINKKVLEYIINNHLSEEYTFSCQTRLEIVHKNQNLINMFRKANMIVGFGFESADERILNEMGKTPNPKHYIQKMKEILEKYKDISEIYCRVNLISGFPRESSNSFQDTANFIKSNALHENIQISPNIFLNDSETYVYQNMDYYSGRFGSQFTKQWWKLDSDPLINAIIPYPSRNYAKKNLISDYITHYGNILKVFKHKSFQGLLAWRVYFENVLNSL